MQINKVFCSIEFTIYYLGFKNDKLLQFGLSFKKQRKEKNIIQGLFAIFFYDKNSSSKNGWSLILGESPYNYYSKLFKIGYYSIINIFTQKNKDLFSFYIIILDKIYYIFGGELKNLKQIETIFNINSI